MGKAEHNAPLQQSPAVPRDGSNWMGTFSIHLPTCLQVFLKDPVPVSLLCHVQVRDVPDGHHDIASCPGLSAHTSVFPCAQPAKLRQPLGQWLLLAGHVPHRGGWVIQQGTFAPGAWRLSAHPLDPQQPVHVTEYFWEMILPKASKGLLLVIICWFIVVRCNIFPHGPHGLLGLDTSVAQPLRGPYISLS